MGRTCRLGTGTENSYRILYESSYAHSRKRVPTATSKSSGGAFIGVFANLLELARSGRNISLSYLREREGRRRDRG
jgi:hypothetical protein